MIYANTLSMEIRDPLHGTIELSNAETTVIDSAEFQRLRQIKQLGFSEFSFPGATHNRYLHSIGVTHVAGLVFNHIFKDFPLSSPAVQEHYRQVTKLAALLHDVGHGPLSHTTEEVMPPVAALKIKAYENRLKTAANSSLRANHEDYTIKYITDSPLTKILAGAFPGFTPLHIACLIDKSLTPPDNFFIDNGLDFRPILSQLVSSELDCDRMDYLERDSFFCGTNYGKFDLPWIISSLATHRVDDKMFLAINRRALYTFDDFLLSRHHMHLMVYTHHKSIIYEEMLNLYLSSKDCSFHLPSEINEYTKYTDYKLYEHLAQSPNPWAQRVAQRRPYKVLIELHNTEESPRAVNIKKALNESGIDVIWSSSKNRLSKYHSTPEDNALQIYVVDQYDRWDKPAPISQSTEIFKRYEGARIIDRLYVAPENIAKANTILLQKKM
jgi:HD superfamily phosphohydrolase